MPHGDHELRADEQHHLAGLDHLGGLGQLGVLDVPGGAQHEEADLVAELLQLRPLRGLDRVLDRELVQAVRLGDASHLGGTRLVQAQPDERVAAPSRLGERLAVVELAGLALAVDVQRAVDDAAGGPGRAVLLRRLVGGAPHPGYGAHRRGPCPGQTAPAWFGAVALPRSGSLCHGTIFAAADFRPHALPIMPLDPRPSPIKESPVEKCAKRDTRRSDHPDMSMIDGDMAGRGHGGAGGGAGRAGRVGGWGERTAHPAPWWVKALGQPPTGGRARIVNS